MPRLLMDPNIPEVINNFECVRFERALLSRKFDDIEDLVRLIHQPQYNFLFEVQDILERQDNFPAEVQDIFERQEEEKRS